MNETAGTPAARLALALVAALGAGGAPYAFAAGGDAAPVVSEPLATAAPRPAVEVWKTPTCGCCSGWVAYLREEGFEVVAHDVEDVDPVRERLGLTDPRLKSCHTATVGGYVIEGHVPVSDIDRLLTERPDLVGISAPGMPMMSPGMGSREPKGYDVIGFDEHGETAVFASH